MISQTWVFDKVTHTRTEDGVDTTEEQSVEDADYEITYASDGTFIIESAGSTIEGTWVFTGTDGLELVYDSDLDTQYPSEITKLTASEFWTSSTNIYDEDGVWNGDNGVSSSTVTESRLIPK